MKKTPYLVAALLAFAQAEESFRLSPSLHMNAVIGTGSADHPAEFAPGAHDPNRKEAFQLQSLEPALSLRAGKHLEGFATLTVFTDDKDHFDWEWEEYFLKLMDGQGNVDLRGGRFLNRVGFYNATHLHGWETVDAPLPHALILGEEGLATEGADLTVYLDTPCATALTFGFGRRPSHDDHHHGQGGDDHDGDDHGGFEAFEDFRATDQLLTVALRGTWRPNDFHAWSGALAFGTGKNEDGEDARFGLVGVEYQWRENGFAAGGRSLTWRTEALRFSGKTHGGHDDQDDEDHHHDDHDGDDHDEDHDEEHGDIRASGYGISSLLAYQATERLRPFARIDRMNSVREIDFPSWTRYTVGLTMNLHQHPTAYARLQANFDERGDESEQAVWLQLGLSFGGGEVR